jgi:DNA-binding transcriptional ArsR family regulator
MGTSKTEHFSESINRMAIILKAMGHPARLAIIEYLRKVDSCICNDLVNELPLAQPTISQHLKELKSADIIKGTIEGNSICYCLNSEMFHELETYFRELRHQVQSANFKCC